MEKHVNVIAALRIGFSILGLVAGIVLFIVLYVIGDFADDNEAKFVLTLIANILIIFFILLSIPGIIAGVGLLRRKEWARILTLILSVFDLFNIPIGTAFGVYSIWALVQPEIVEIFQTQK